MKIINTHIHINPISSNCFFYNDYTFEDFFDEFSSNSVTMALPSLNPKLEIFRCSNDCSFNCLNFSSPNNNMENCDYCKLPNKHRTAIYDNNGYLTVYCKTCGTILYTGADPVHNLNVELIEKTRMFRNCIEPFVFLTICPSTIQNEIDFFEKNYSGEFVGYKLHPWTNQASVDKLNVKTALPFLIHTGVRQLESTENALIFAKNHPRNNIVIAHAAQLNSYYLTEISKLNNVFVDCCPSVFMHKLASSAFTPPVILSSPADIYTNVLKYLGPDKLLFGTDSPWGSTTDELGVVNSLNVSDDIKEKILFKNAKKVYSL